MSTAPRHVLIFPAMLLETALLLPHLSAEGDWLITASSDPNEPGLALGAQSHTLPYIWESRFAESLLNLLASEQIEVVFCPHPRCYETVTTVLRRANHPAVVKFGRSASWPGMQEKLVAAQEAILATATAPIYAEHTPPAPRRALIPPHHLATLLRQAALVPGQSHMRKLAAMALCAATLPQGDLVDIGVATGRSTLFLMLLRRYYDLGPILAVDPFDEEHVFQDINILDEIYHASHEKNPVERLAANLNPYRNEGMAFLHAPSFDAAQRYAVGGRMGDPPFDTVTPLGQIALLHIDGNHALNQARADLAAWAGYVQPGGWIVMDDYAWIYGDGPRQAANEWLAAHAARVAQSRIIDNALFIQLR